MDYFSPDNGNFSRAHSKPVKHHKALESSSSIAAGRSHGKNRYVRPTSARLLPNLDDDDDDKTPSDVKSETETEEPEGEFMQTAALSALLKPGTLEAHKTCTGQFC